MTEQGRFVWHDLMTKDVDAAEAFYTKLFGWEVRVVDMGPAGKYRMVHVAETSVGGIVGLGEADLPSHWICYVTVANVDDTLEIVRSAGGTIHVEPFDIPNAGRIAVIEDPTGAYLSPFTPIEQSPESEGPTHDGFFGWYQLNTRDPQAAENFYSEMLAWTVRSADMGSFGTYWTFHRNGNMEAGMMQMPSDAKATSHWLPYVAVSDIQSAVEQTAALGGKVWVPPTHIPEPGSGTFAVIADPTGASLGLYQD